MSTRLRVLAHHRNLVARRAVPRWYPMTPAKLPRDAPVVDVFHPVQVSFPIHLRRESDVTIFHRCYRAISERLNLNEPLQREPRLHNRLAAVAVAHVVDVVF